MAAGRGRVSNALSSARALHENINNLSEAELKRALELESAAQRRPVVLERLVQRLVRVIEIRTKDELTRRYTPWLVENQSS